MDQIANLVNQQAINSQNDYKSLPKEKDLLPESIVLMIFKRFEAAWGDIWLRKFSSDESIDMVVLTWREALAGLDAEMVRNGIQSVVKWCKWPPTPSEFLEYANPRKPAMQAYHMQTIPRSHRLENVASKETASENIKKIREMLGAVHEG